MTDFVGHKLGLGNKHKVGDGQEVHSLILQSER